MVVKISEHISIVLQQDMSFSGCKYPYMECYKGKESNGIYWFLARV